MRRLAVIVATTRVHPVNQMSWPTPISISVPFRLHTMIDMVWRDLRHRTRDWHTRSAIYTAFVSVGVCMTSFLRTGYIQISLVSDKNDFVYKTPECSVLKSRESTETDGEEMILASIIGESLRYLYGRRRLKNKNSQKFVFQNPVGWWLISRWTEWIPNSTHLK